jgi:predicted kinase
MLVLLRGRPGTGKSTLADAFGRHLRAAVIDKDDIKDILDTRYRDEWVGGFSYEIMLRIAERCLSQGIDVICDSPLTYPDLYERAVALAARYESRVLAIRTVCSDQNVWRGRLEARTEFPDHRMKFFDAQQLLNEERYVVPDELVVDTARPLDACLRDVLALIDQTL